MKDLTEKIYKEKKMQRVSWNTLAENLPISGEALRVSFVRDSVDENYLNEVCKKLKINTYNKKEDKNIETVEEPTTNYYYPDVNASAGLETEMQNDELNRIPINIPNWERGIAFINVYGDSMYPKFCNGEIIGIKEVEPQYINYGYAYVVIFNDGQVFLKYIRKGKDNEHWVLDSENPKYESREYHLSLIKKIFIIKGVITKTTM
ncbi:MAG: S24 family peptidase [Flavobacterium sp.]|uniref:S24 family peptidase n=1 Tax=Flavobacterium sp. TaxID=239 RepID=UPI002B49B7A6|nr:S24 family peptidase [Flavobacterium sp.]WRH74198.1 MAG: S24 family peptidase [Flavobacterium sp.]